jgi:tetratricopeptide (TPR) repeat protein/tRNA A-37 threonylcarbamoyl transferase component Bud32
MSDATPSRPAADRNLLFGILALQMDFITRDALIKAMNAWVLEKAKPLSQILSEQGALGADERAALDTLVAQHLRRHGSDAEQSLAAIPVAPAVRHALQSVADPDLQASINGLALTPERTPDLTGPYQPPATDGSRYRVLRPHARGGLGEVFVAEDTELHREVALKEIQAERAHDPSSRSRFLLEAEVNGRLEHPHIVPVYGLGAYPDGRPFYAMRFIQGDTLKDAIRRFHAKDGSGRDVGERSLALRQLLGQLVAVCNAVAYAHSRGVVHRDLKPANVLLGPFGETLLVDWGLAKVVGRAEEGACNHGATLRPVTGSELATQAGAAIGTPGYMSPEQAQGRLEQVGPASDIYGLGAALYAVLTGSAPVEGQDNGEVLRRVSQGDWPPPSQIKKTVPRALEAVCLKAMALHPEGRYATVQELARDIEHWLADEPVSAWCEPLRTRAGRWVRRHQTGVAAAAAALLVAVLLGGAGAVGLERQRAERQAEQVRQQEQRRQTIGAALAEVGRLQEQSRWSEARAVLRQADTGRVEDGSEDLRRRLIQARSEVELVEQLEGIRMARAGWLEHQFDDAWADRDYARIFAEAGLGQEGDPIQAVAERVGASVLRGPLLGALDDWASCARSEVRRAWVLAVARRADPHPWRDRARDPALWGDREALVQLAAQPEAEEQPPPLVAAVAIRLGDARAGLLRRAQARHPNDFWLTFFLGDALMGQGAGGGPENVQEAVEYYRAALSLRPDTMAVLVNLGSALLALGRREEALAAYHRASLVEPNRSFSHINLARELDRLGQHEEALAEYRTAVRIAPKNTMPHTALGTALGELGRWEEALGAFKEAIRLAPSAATHYNLGNALRQMGRLEEARTAYREALRLDPNFAEAHCNLGQVLQWQGQFSDAVAAFQRGHELGSKKPGWHYPSAQWVQQAERLVALDGKVAAVLKGEAVPADATERARLGWMCMRNSSRLYRAAARFYAEAFAADPKLADDLEAAHRYNGACATALAGSGQGKDADTVGDQERAGLRQLALDWLKAELVVRKQQVRSGVPKDRAQAQQKLRHWQRDPDLAGVRGEALAKLPDAEAAAWKQLWAEVGNLLERPENEK